MLRYAALSLLLLLISASCSCAQDVRRRVSILSIPGLTSRDLTRPEVPFLRSIVNESAVGWMNSRTARVVENFGKTSDAGVIEAAAYLTLGSGSRATAEKWAQ